jgi:mannose-6-phosphate isomerase-like protein (cupin superfamily)/catechol 2,3-dioxygenase-like lactoylglutathione lyase family enzyme
VLHHLSIAVVDLARSAVFYDAALAPLGYVRVFGDDTCIGYGLPGSGDKFAIKLRPDATAPGSGSHIAFAAPDRQSVDRFHQAALRHGGRDNGAAGLRPHYGKNYYAAFVRDPDGYYIEAVINDTIWAHAEPGRRPAGLVRAMVTGFIRSVEMRIELGPNLSQLPLPATTRWPQGVWDRQAFSHGSMSVIVFAPRGKDYQTSHRQDELYVVLKGSGVLVIESTRHPFSEGDVLFVPANRIHRFEEFSPDFVTWAIFWGPDGGEQT